MIRRGRTKFGSCGNFKHIKSKFYSSLQLIVAFLFWYLPNCKHIVHKIQINVFLYFIRWIGIIAPLTMPEVDLGFAEKCPSWKLESRFFPSKIGGAPAWLNLAELPNPDQLSCSKCNHQLKFLCQIYAPVNEKSDCFHRTIFVFFCSSAECSNVNRGIYFSPKHIVLNSFVYFKQGKLLTAFI